MLLVAIGGSIGALLRWIVDQWIPLVGDWPLPTLLVNVFGAGALALLLINERYSWQRPLVGTGLLGGFTTFSAVVGQLRIWATGDGNLLVSLGYLTLSVGFSLALVALILRKSS